MAVWVPVGGQLYVFEIVALVIILHGFRRLRGRKYLRTMLLLGLIWAAGQLLSDLQHGLSVSEMIRGQALILFLLVNLLAITVVIQDSVTRFCALALGYGVATLLGYFLQPGPFAAELPWKFGVGLGSTVLAIAVATVVPSAVRYLGLAALAAVHLYLGWRSEALIVGSALAAYAITGLRRHGVLRVLAVACVVGLAPGVLTAYSRLADSGALGPAAQEKFRIQSAGSLGVLGGRPEFIFALEAIREFPLLGIGSMAQNSGEVYERGQQEILRLGYNPDTLVSRQALSLDTVPLHSHALGAVAMAGVLAAPFWILVARVLVLALFNLGKLSRPVQILFAFLLVSAIWDLMFSPLGAFARFQFALEVVGALIILGRRDNQDDHDRDDLLQPSAVSARGR